MLWLFCKSVLMGFLVAAPVGPIGMLCIHRSLHDGQIAGLITGFGAAVADGCYAAIAALGLGVVSTFLITHRFAIHLFGGVFLIYLGLRIFLATPNPSPNKSKRYSGHYLFKIFGSTFILTLSNPLTILAFTGIFAGLGFGSKHLSPQEALILLGGIFIGSLTWWFVLSTTISHFLHHKLSIPTLKKINHFSGIIITLLGAGVLFDKI